MKIVGIGESVLDIVLRNGQALAAVPGGSTFNAIISLGRTAGRRFPGLPIVMITQTGDDQVADIMTDFMARNNVSADGVRRERGTQSVVSIALLNDRSDASYEFFRDSRTPAFVPNDIEFEAGDIVLFGSFFAINDNTQRQTAELIGRAREAGAVIYYDVNFRKSHLAELEHCRPFIERNCAMSDIVRASDEDIRYVWGSADPDKVYAENISRLCPNYICTRGADSVEVFSPAGKAEFPVAKIETVSTIGAGDNFNAGILYALLSNGFGKEKLGRLSPEDWSLLVPMATRFSANVCQSIFNYVDPDFVESL